MRLPDGASTRALTLHSGLSRQTSKVVKGNTHPHTHSETEPSRIKDSIDLNVCLIASLSGHLTLSHSSPECSALSPTTAPFRFFFSSLCLRALFYRPNIAPFCFPFTGKKENRGFGKSVNECAFSAKSVVFALRSAHS